MARLLIVTLLWLVCVDWSQAVGLQARSDLQHTGDYNIAGLFPLHNSAYKSTQPSLPDCAMGAVNKHGYHLVQAMRFAVEEINNGSLLPGVTLGYQTYDICCDPAATLATVELLAQQYRLQAEPADWTQQDAVAVIGPDSSTYAFTPAAALGYYQVPEISYEASSELLSNKILYPAFFRTIPSDRNQVVAMLELLARFNWTWIALLGSNNDYGLQGMLSLSQQASAYGVCIAYQGVIPSYSSATRPQIQAMVRSIVQTQVTTIVAFSSKRIVSGFFRVVIEEKVEGKVWIGTEDWSPATLVSGIPGIESIGTVLGISLIGGSLPGFLQFEQVSMANSKQAFAAFQSYNDTWQEDLACLQNSSLRSLTLSDLSMDEYDSTSAFNVYTAVYALAHALHSLLNCDSAACQKTEVVPWQLLQKLKQVRFTVANTTMYFDQNGDPPTGYHLVTWNWTGGSWSLQTIGTFRPNPPTLDINAGLIKWSSKGPDPVPLSICSPACPKGYKQIQTGQHKCCFDCQACPAATFLNTSADMSTCQPCLLDEWSPAESDHCLARTVIYLPWDGAESVVLLLLLTLTLLLILGTGATFLLHLHTPVVKSAGGRTCLLMLSSLLCATLNGLCYLGEPSPLGCVLKQPLFTFSFTVCLSCVAVRSFQVVCIFKLSSKLPRAYETWAKNGGPQVVIAVVSILELLVSVVRVSVDTPAPTRNYEFYSDSVVLECSRTLSAGACLELAYLALLSGLCFCFNYMGKDLPANYSEAKCITFSLMVYILSWISVFTIYSINRSSYLMVLQVMALVTSVLGMLAGYFLPKVYIILLKPQMNTTAHFQNCIQMYTMSKE